MCISCDSDRLTAHYAALAAGISWTSSSVGGVLTRPSSEALRLDPGDRYRQIRWWDSDLSRGKNVLRMNS